MYSMDLENNFLWKYNHILGGNHGVGMRIAIDRIKSDSKDIWLKSRNPAYVYDHDALNRLTSE